MKVRYTRRAIGDISAIARYIREHSPSAAANVEMAIRKSVSRLAEHPNLGSWRSALGVRALSVPRFAYTIYYRVAGTEIHIVHVRDHRRKPLEPDDI